MSSARRLALIVAACSLSACHTSDSSSGDPSSAGASASASAGADNAGGAGPSAGSGSGGAGPSAGSGGDGAAAAVTGAEAMAGAPSAPPDSTECSQLSVATCATNPTCQALSAQRVTSELCLAPSEAVACGTTVGCVVKATRAIDSAGQSWIFASTCIPAGWPDISAMGTRFDPCEASGSGGAAP